MDDAKEQIVKMLNAALELEHAARIQYLAHAELVKGENSEKIVERLKEIASDEGKHEEIFRKLVGSYLDAEPAMGLSATHRAKGTTEIFEVNLKDEKGALAFYKQIHKKVIENKDAFPLVYETLEHEVRHVIMDEQEHVMELSTLLGR